MVAPFRLNNYTFLSDWTVAPFFLTGQLHLSDWTFAPFSEWPIAPYCQLNNCCFLSNWTVAPFFLTEQLQLLFWLNSCTLFATEQCTFLSDWTTAPFFQTEQLHLSLTEQLHLFLTEQLHCSFWLDNSTFLSNLSAWLNNCTFFPAFLSDWSIPPYFQLNSCCFLSNWTIAPFFLTQQLHLSFLQNNYTFLSEQYCTFLSDSTIAPFFLTEQNCTFLSEQLHPLSDSTIAPFLLTEQFHLISNWTVALFFLTEGAAFVCVQEANIERVRIAVQAKLPMPELAQLLISLLDQLVQDCRFVGSGCLVLLPTVILLPFGIATLKKRGLLSIIPFITEHQTD